MSGFFGSNQTWNPAQPPIPIGSVGQVLTVQANGTLAFAAGGGGGTQGYLGARLAYASAAGVSNNVTPAGWGPTIGRLIVNTSAGAAEWTGFIAGTDAQLVRVDVVETGGTNLQIDSKNAGSLAANQFHTVTAGFTCFPGSSFWMSYDATGAFWKITP